MTDVEFHAHLAERQIHSQNFFDLKNVKKFDNLYMSGIVVAVHALLLL